MVNLYSSRGTDYLAVQHDALYVVAPSNLANDRKQLPADAYNALTVTAAQVDAAGVFRRVSTPPVVDDNGRRLTDIIAPGIGVTAPTPTPDGTGAFIGGAGGTSRAAPHATATVALLQARCPRPQSRCCRRVSGGSKSHPHEFGRQSSGPTWHGPNGAEKKYSRKAREPNLG